MQILTGIATLKKRLIYPLILFGMVFSMVPLLAFSEMHNKPAEVKAVKKASRAGDLTLRSAKEEVQTHAEHLRQIMVRLYQLNPLELQKSTKVSAEEFMQWVFEGPFNWKFDAIRKLQQTDALMLAFDPEYQSDRVFPLIVGMQTMLIHAYAGKSEFLFTNEIIPQRLFHAARNLEIAAWKMQNSHVKELKQLNSSQEITKMLHDMAKRVDQYANESSLKTGKPISRESVDPATASFMPLTSQ